ncbi:hypothetical protein OCC_01534 [Thermococcus litoralis DSM 5473]|uniref:Squalene-hopene cyclase n=1 Tax=Thermococcus litoralis (strain ATCC 51850 / DSM 5473 / JCM 8560 / NS-C) TaxID=523849 RepID=H3ZLN2_THELN|nr:prenyltransferase/squalene oxidase repeat-containing protein [Thermococcus litoralis]EHR79170.1 hypothetical protein OCC_01534 [Thermococcus litoralis DSM 5473]
MKRVVPVLLVVMMILPYAGAVPILDSSVRFLLQGEEYAETTEEMSLSLLALTMSYGMASNLSIDNITSIAYSLLYRQNEDGGWGYYEGSTSNVVDTSYAIIALKSAISLYERGTSPYRDISNAVTSGIRFLLNSYSVNGWGYVPNTLPEFYPTVMAIWALGENGYSAENENIKNAVEFLENVEKTELREGKALALRILAYKSVGYKIDSSLIEKAWELVNSKDITIEEKALLTYALLNYEGLSFKTAVLLAELENLKDEDSFVYWANKPEGLVERDVITTSALATLDIGYAELGLPPALASFSRELCSVILSSQNPDGGWSYLEGYPSNEIATYYVLSNIEYCFSREGVDKALEWAREKLSVNKKEVLRKRELSPRYVYNILLLARFNMLDGNEKKENIEIIKSLKLKDGLWGNVLGPQPKDTALAVKALLALGVPPSDQDIQEAKRWLLSISEGGWGTYVQTEYYPYMITPEVETTLEVLEALLPISSKDELQRNIEWLIDQRGTDGRWANVKELHIYNVLIYEGEPRTDLTARAIALLSSLGYNYRDEFISWVMDHRNEITSRGNLVEIPLILNVLYTPTYGIDIWWVNRVLEKEDFKVVYTSGKYYTASFVRNALEKHLNRTLPLSEFEGFKNSNYVIIGGLDDFNISEYNPAVSMEVENSKLIVNGHYYPLKDSGVIVAGKHEQNYMLFVLYNGSSRVVREIFDLGMFKYFKGPAVVAWYRYDTPWTPELMGEFVR